MRQLLELTKRAAAALPGGAAAAAPRADGAPETPEPKAPPGLPLAFMLSHLEDEGPVRLDRVRVSICEVLGPGAGRAEARSLRGRAQRLRLRRAAARCASTRPDPASSQRSASSS